MSQIVIRNAHKRYLDNLKASGKINMFDAYRYVSINFNLSIEKAKNIVLQWMAEKENKAK